MPPKRFNRSEHYFWKIKDVWRRFERFGHIIPFRTPVIECPEFLVIGKNHSAFVPRDKANIGPPNEFWMGTNRWAIQTSEADGRRFDDVENARGFAGAQREMDQILRDLISEFSRIAKR